MSSPPPNGQQKDSKSPFNWFNAVILIASIIIFSIVGNAVEIYFRSSNEGSNQILSPMPTTTTPTHIPTTLPTTPGQSCVIIGKWIQTKYENNPVTGVYIQIYSDNRIEIYLNNQLRSWGTYDIIALNQIRHTWTGGVDTGTGDTITMSPDCQTLDVVSFRDEHSTFIRTYN